MQINKQEKIIGKTEFFIETGYVLKDIVGDILGSYNSNIEYKRNEFKTNIIIRRDNKTYLMIELTEDELWYEVMINTHRKRCKYVKQEEVNNIETWEKYIEQVKEDFSNLIDYVGRYYRDEKDIEYCEFKYSKDYIIKEKKYKL